MIFNTFDFLWLFPIIFGVYYLLAYRQALVDKFPKIGNAVLLVISYGLYIKWNPVYALLLLGITAVTFFAALKIEKDNAFGKKKYIVGTGIVLTVLPLLIFKYYNFFTTQFNEAFSWIGLEIGLSGLNWIMPLGISFFTLQAIGYLADVYLQRIKAEHNWWDYMLFICFFPQIASGPISKAKDLLPQIKAKRVFSETQFVQGCKWLLWGMFMKVVVADRLGMNVNDAYLHLSTEGGATLFYASLFYIIEVYCDFAGYSYMALGVSEILGFELVNNFQRPFFSQSITEFWRRWHISLSTWLKDYIYIPLGGSRCSKWRNYWNIFITFVVSGLWHGANWTFVVWGGLHGIFQIIEKATKINVVVSTGFIKFLRVVLTFLLFGFSMIFFYMPDVWHAVIVIGKIFTNFSGSFTTWIPCLLFSSIVFFKDLMDEYDIKPLRLLHSPYKIIRWSTYVLLLFMIMVFGVYGGQFIYSGF